MERIKFTVSSVIAVVLFVIACISWVYAYQTYKANKVDIWLSVEDIVLTVTLPFKLAMLAGEPRDNALPVPVDDVRVREIADTWGDAREMGRTHEGVDIFAPRGTPVYAATPGYVVRVGENRLGGRVVFTMGPGGVRYYYAHLDRIAEGITPGLAVTHDTVIGFVGNSGNATGTLPHLHFGMYQNGPENPYPLLVDRK